MSEKLHLLKSISRIRQVYGGKADEILETIANEPDSVNMFMELLGKEGYTSTETVETPSPERKPRKASAAKGGKSANNYPDGKRWGLHGKPKTPEEREAQLKLKDNSPQRIKMLNNMKFSESDSESSESETSTERWFRLTGNRTPSTNIDELSALRRKHGLSEKDRRFLDKRIALLQSGKKEQRGNRWARWFGVVSKTNLNATELRKAVQEGKTEHAGKLSKDDIAAIKEHLDSMEAEAKTGSHTEKAKNISRRSARSTRGKGNSGAHEPRKSQGASA